MNRKFLCDIKLRVELCILMFGLALFVSCQSKVERDKQFFAKDPAAIADFQKINIDLNTTKQISLENFEKLKKLHLKYPASPEILQSYKAALIFREDWGGLVQLLTEMSPTEQSRADRVLLAKAYVKLGKFSESSGIIQDIESAASMDVDMRSLAASAHFGLAELDEAAADLDAVWDAIISQKRIDDINLRGMIHFGKKNYKEAIETLSKSLEIAPQNPVACNTLSRVYAATGDTEMAEKYRLETERAHDQATREENRKMTFVSLADKLKSAWDQRRYDEVVRLSREMIPIADQANKEAVYKYLAEAQMALGNRAAADEAIAEIRKLKEK